MASAACVILAAGMGHRLGASEPKAFVPIDGLPILGHAVDAALTAGIFDEIVVAAPAGWEGRATRIVAEVAASRRSSASAFVVTGGVARSDSVSHCESALTSAVDFVLVHDSARCLAPPELFATVLAHVRESGSAVVPALPVQDTIKAVTAPGGADDELVAATLDRESLRAVQTPQGFRRIDLRAALSDDAARAGATDDASLVAATGAPVRLVPGHPEAFKITRSFDLMVAAAVLAERRRGGEQGHQV